MPSSMVPVCSCAFLRTILHTRPRVQQAPGIPCALCFLWAEFLAQLGRFAPREREFVFTVIARSEATKQSILPLCGKVDCFAEPVIGRAFARPVGSQ